MWYFIGYVIVGLAIGGYWSGRKDDFWSNPAPFFICVFWPVLCVLPIVGITYALGQRHEKVIQMRLLETKRREIELASIERELDLSLKT